MRLLGGIVSRCFVDSSTNGPIKLDGAARIERCFDCSRSGDCEEQRASSWPATTIPAGCTLPDATRDEDGDEMPELWLP